jgi:hypothetical protein
MKGCEMDTATQLLERCAELIDQNLSFIDESENLLKDIEAYLAKPKVKNQSITYCYFDNSKELNGYRSAK